jgi:hypothetical protein
MVAVVAFDAAATGVLRFGMFAAAEVDSLVVDQVVRVTGYR